LSLGDDDAQLRNTTKKIDRKIASCFYLMNRMISILLGKEIEV
jgi:hypothetical protein